MLLFNKDMEALKKGADQQEEDAITFVFGLV